jgi:hypothetical protein
LYLVGCRSVSDLPKICLTAENGPDLSHLADPLSERVSAVIDEFPDVLTPRLGLTTLLEYDIELLDHTPVTTLKHIYLNQTLQFRLWSSGLTLRSLVGGY